MVSRLKKRRLKIGKDKTKVPEVTRMTTTLHQALMFSIRDGTLQIVQAVLKKKNWRRNSTNLTTIFGVILPFFKVTLVVGADDLMENESLVED